MNLNDLPCLALRRIAEYLNEETAFRDKVDIGIDSASLALVGAKYLSAELNNCIDPSSKNGKLSECVKKNLQTKKHRWISEQTAISIWGLTLEELKDIPSKRLDGFNSTRLYRFQFVKRKCAAKFCESYERFKAYTSRKQLERSQTLDKELTKHGLSLRLDSKFCDSYIRFGRGDPNEIAKSLKEMSFYHTFTDYLKYFWMYAAKYACDQGYYDRDEVSAQAKKRALNDFVQKYPEKQNLIPQSLHRFICS